MTRRNERSFNPGCKLPSAWPDLPAIPHRDARRYLSEMPAT